MRLIKSLLIAAPIVAGLLSAPMAHADWHGGGGWHGGGWHGDYHGGGPGFGGVLLGLGAAAVVGGLIASQAYVPPPAVVYAQPPVYYAPPPVVYAPPPGYYAAPPVYYARPAY